MYGLSKITVCYTSVVGHHQGRIPNDGEEGIAPSCCINPLMPWQVKNDNFDNDEYYQ
jgi:hypothetical protein